MRRAVPFLLVALMVAGACAGAATAEPTTKTARPTTAIGQKGCVRAECHAVIKDQKVLHGPVAVNTCDACHEAVDVEAHTWKLARQKAELCTYCHEFSVVGMPVVHKPVALGECLGCHDPHGGRNRTLTREASTAELCGRCHESIAKGKTFLHSPVAQGECDSCHPPHAARFPKLLDAAGTDLCLTCHTGFDQSLAKAPVKHQALKEGCGKCHDPHGSSQPMALVKPVGELCVGCHKKVQEQAQQAKVKHTVVLTDKACVNCHTSHGGTLPKLLSDLPSKTCMTCHKNAVRAEDGRTVAGATDIADPKLLKHGPLKDGQCTGCHISHGSDQPMLLAKVYSDRQYQKFAPEQYELCFSCHDVNLVQQKSTQTATKFRNGSRNLHAVHVEDVRGKSCRLCHAVHATSGEGNVRDLVTFGKWNMPVKLTKSATGGSCTPGCHNAYGYDRDNPLPEAELAPTTRQSPVIARGENEDAILVQLSARDAAGAEVKVPDAAAPTVLLFVRAEQARDEKLIKAVADAVSAGAKIKAALIVAGSETIDPAAINKASGWPVVMDPDNELGAKLDVHAWPAAMIVQSDGLLLVRLNASLTSLPLRLGAYVDVATGKTDRPMAERRIATVEVVTDEESLRAGRQLRLAEKWLEEGNAAQALYVLNEALKAQPDRVALKVGLVRALIGMNKGTEALTALGKLPKDALPADQAGMLRARALIAANRWDEARAALDEVVKQNAALPEAHYLLGQAYEHQQEWQKAAAEYRMVQELKKQ